MRTKTNPLAALAALAITSSALFAPWQTSTAQDTVSGLPTQINGVLKDGGVPFDGVIDMLFELVDPLTGTPYKDAAPVLKPVIVTEGIFNTKLEFQHVFDSRPYAINILVENGAGGFISLGPPHVICPAPTAQRAGSAETVDSIPSTALPPEVPILSGPLLPLPDPTGGIIFGPTGECFIGLDPQFSGLVERDPNGFRLLGGDEGRGCILNFGPTDDCRIWIDPDGPGGLLLSDPIVRILPTDPGVSPLLAFGPTDLCTLGIDPDLPGLTERDPTGFRLLGQNGQGCRLLFGPTPDCTIEIDPLGPSGLLLRDLNCIRLLPPVLPGGPLIPPVICFGPTDDCRIGIDPDNGGLTLSDPGGINIGNGDGVLRFGPECTIGIDPELSGVVLRDPSGFRIDSFFDIATLRFGPGDECTIGIDPNRGSGLLLSDPIVRILPPDSPAGPPLPATIAFGPTDECTIGLDPELGGIVERDPTGFRLLGRNLQGCRLLFGPTDDCTVEVDPQGPDGLLLRDPNGIRILNPDAAGNPALRFGPTDECILLADPDRGLLLSDPRGITLPWPTSPAGGLLPAVLAMGDAGECRWRVNAPDTGPQGMILEDPEGLLLVNPQGGAGALSFGESGLCRLHVGELPNRQNGLMISDPGGLQVNSPESFFDVIFATEFVQTSTRRLKDNIQPIEEPIEKIKQLEGVTFDWKPERGGKPSLGFIAEDVGKVFPQVVSYEKDGVNARGVNYGHLVAVTVEGIKQQQGQIETQQDEIEELRAENDALQARLERLEALMQATLDAKEAADDKPSL